MIGRSVRWPVAATSRQMTSAAPYAMASGIASSGGTVATPPRGRATTRTRASPPAQHSTPTRISQSGHRCRNQDPISAAKIRSQTRIGWTRASAP